MKILLTTYCQTFDNTHTKLRNFGLFFLNFNPINFIIPFFIIAKPIHAEMQYIEGFAIDQTEVTVGKFSEFVVATGYKTSAEKKGGGLVYRAGWEKMDGWVWSSPFGTAAKADEPAVHLTFDDAKAYCSWIGKRLPTDKEWVKAAYTEFRSSPPPPFVTGFTYPYPTGDSPMGANCLKECGPTPTIDYSARLSRGTGPSLAGTTKAGVNGLFDMGANVWEWTENGMRDEKSTRGGSWWYGSFQMKEENSTTKPMDMAVVYIGFRCAKDTS